MKLSLRRLSLIILVYGLIGLFMLWPLPLNFASAIPGEGFDGWQNFWNLWWVRRALYLGISPWLATVIDYPAEASLYFHTLNISNAWLSLPVQEIAGLYVAYNTVVVASFALSGLGAYLLAKRVMGNTANASAGTWVAGLIYACSPFHFAHVLGHMQVFAMQWLPFYCLGMWNSLEKVRNTGHIPDKPWRYAVLPALFLVLAALTDWYNLLYLGLATLVLLFWYCGCHWRSADKYILSVLWVFLPALLALSPLLAPMVAEALRDSYMVPDQSQIPLLSADFLSFFLSQGFHPLWGEWVRSHASWQISRSEHTLSFGLVPLLLAAAAWWQGKRNSRPFVWLWLVFTTLALGPMLHIGGKVIHLGRHELALPYLLLYTVVPFMGIARSVSRFSIISVLALSILAGLGVQIIANADKKFAGRHNIRLKAKSKVLYLSALISLFILFEFLPVPYPLTPSDAPAWYTQMAEEQGQFSILNLPVNWDRPQYLLYQTIHQRPLVSAYTSRRNPLAPVEQYPGLQQLRSLSDDILGFPDAATFATIAADLGLRYIVLDNYQMPGQEEREPTEKIAAQLLAGSPAIYTDERLKVYRLETPQTETGYVKLVGPWGTRTGLPGQPARTVCKECGLQAHVSSERALSVMVQCDGGRQTQFFLVDGQILEMHSALPLCRQVYSVTWNEVDPR